MEQAFVIDGLRSPIGNFGGALSHVRCDDLAAGVIRELMQKFPDLPKNKIDDVIMGCANQAGEDNRNVSRMALLLAGLPETVPGETVNRLCASGMSAVAHAARTIKAGEGHLFIAGGVEHMTRSPWVISKTSTPFGRDAQMFDSSFGWRFVNPKMHEMYGTDSMGQTAENLREIVDVSREDQDLFAYRSQMKATKARNNGRFDIEMAPVEIPQRKGNLIRVDRDEFIKPDTSLEVLAKLRPAFKSDGTVTAGNASGLNDGAAALLIASSSAVNEYDLKPLARIVSSAVTGVAPRIMGLGPVEASHLALQRAGLGLDQIDIFEFNEAFAIQTLACTRTLGIADDDPRLNPNGGAIALGHPLGMTGARLVLTASRELERTGKKYALCAMCIGVGQGYAMVLENPNA